LPIQDPDSKVPKECLNRPCEAPAVKLIHICIANSKKSLPFQDPDGSYIARWVPELAKLPKKYLHMPWKAPEDTLKAAGVSFGAKEGQYPHRITAEVMQVVLQRNPLC